MEQKTKALKTSNKVIAVIMKIGFIAMIVALCVCAAALIFTAATGGQTSVTTGEISFVIADDLPADPAELVVKGTVYLVMSGFLLAIFFLAQKMFGEISKSGDPFTARHVKTVRVIGILVAAMTFAVGLADAITSAYLSTSVTQTYPEAPGFVFGAIIFCLSYILDYGCALKDQVAAQEKV